MSNRNYGIIIISILISVYVVSSLTNATHIVHAAVHRSVHVATDALQDDGVDDANMLSDGHHSSSINTASSSIDEGEG